MFKWPIQYCCGKEPHIASLLLLPLTVPTVLALFAGAGPGRCVPGHCHGCFQYHVRSMVCYYGQHHIVSVLMSNSLWYMFDDAHILCIGLWADVVSRCELGRIQASVLFFEHRQVGHQVAGFSVLISVSKPC